MFQAIADGIDINTRHPLGWTALHTAAINQKVDVIKVLLHDGADVNAGDNFVNVYRTAMEMGLHSLDGIYVLYYFHTFHFLINKAQEYMHLLYNIHI